MKFPLIVKSPRNDDWKFLKKEGEIFFICASEKRGENVSIN